MTRKARRHLTRASLVSAAAVSLAGCAALVIDVDVYKGPLGNDPDVQFEQIVSLAMGAKPLLIQLRDRLELPVGHERLKWQLQHIEGSVISGVDMSREAYRAGFIPPTPGRSLPALQSEYARQVNAVLYLYDDAPNFPPRVASLWTTIVAAMNRYAIAEDIVNITPDELSGEVKAWNKLRKDFESSHLPPGVPKAFTSWRKKLFDAYEQFGTSTGFRSRSLIAAIKMSNNLSQELPLNLADRFLWPKTELCVFGSLKERGQSNTFFYYLGRRDLIKMHADVLFPNRRKAQDDFIDRVTIVGTAFHQARAAIEAIFSTTLALAEHMESDSLFKKDNPTDYWKLRQACIDIVLGSVSSRLWEKKDVLKTPRALTSRAGLRNALEREEEYGQTVKQLLELHLRALGLGAGTKPPDSNEDIACDCKTTLEKYNDFKYGLATGPTSEAGEELLGSKFRSLQKRPGLAGGLEGGRPVEGLERLVEEYTKTRMRREYDVHFVPTEARLPHDRLMLALLHFAQKLQTLANYSQLVQSLGTTDRVYQRVLQSIATAMLTQIDDLRKMRVHDKMLVDGAPAESRALRRAWGASATEQLSAIIAAIQESKLKAEARRSSQEMRLEALTASYDQCEAACRESAIAAWRGKIDELIRAAVLRDLTQDQRVRFADTLKQFRSANTTETSFDEIKQAWSVNAILEQLASIGDGSAPVDDSVAREKSLAESLADRAQKVAMQPEQQAKWLWRGFTGCVIQKLVPTNETPSFATVAGLSDFAGNELDQIEVDILVEQAKADWSPNNAVRQRFDDMLRAVQSHSGVIRRQLDGLEARISSLDKALEQIRSQRSAFEQTLAETGDAVNTADALASYLTALHTGAANNGDDQQASFADTIDIIREHRGAATLLPLAEEASHQMSIDVLDEAIAGLEYLRAKALAGGRKVESEDRRLAAAIKALRARRANQLYIRPSSTYLRNSYAVTGFQREPTIMLKNILLQDGSLLSDSELRTAVDIDHQFWQNINHIYVKGGDTTNYAVTRDDVGNFVVRRFVSDPKRLLSTATNLATFAASKAITSANPLLANLGADERITGTEALVPVDREILAIEERRVREEVKDYKNLGALAAFAQQRLQSGAQPGQPLESIGKEIEAAPGKALVNEIIERAKRIDVDQAISELRRATTEGKRYDLSVSAEAAYAAVFEYYQQVHMMLDERFGNANVEAERVRAIRFVNSALGRPLMEAASRRRQALAGIADVLDVIGRAHKAEF